MNLRDHPIAKLRPEWPDEAVAMCLPGYFVLAKEVGLEAAHRWIRSIVGLPASDASIRDARYATAVVSEFKEKY